MTENEIKIGDKITTTKNYDIDINGYSTTIPTGEIGLIEDIDDDELYVSFSGYGVFLTLPASDVEPIQPLDRRTAFLTRLQSLLREFDASIGYFIGDDDKYGWCDYPTLKIGDEVIKYPAGEIDEINADNIMDFDKE